MYFHKATPLWICCGPTEVVDLLWTHRGGGFVVDPQRWWICCEPTEVVDLLWTHRDGGFVVDPQR